MTRGDDFYRQQTRVEPDAAAGGWFINLGLTGARGRMSTNAPAEIVVAYVFPDTPAVGRLEAGDRIVGANGRPFATPHKFGYGMDKFGYEGPLMDLGNALEESQGAARAGRLELDLVRGDEAHTVTLTLPTRYGRYATTYPRDCEKSALLRAELCAWLAERQREDGSWTSGRLHVDALAALALMAGGDERYALHVERAMRRFAVKTNDRIDYGGYDCWKYGLYGICLAEYYLATEAEWVRPELEEINRWLVKAQFAANYRRGRGAGGWGHRPTGRPGGNGYGPICMITAQAMTAWGLIGQCGIPVDRDRYLLARDFICRGTNNIGYVWYADGNGGDDQYADMGRTGAGVVAFAMGPDDVEGLRAAAKQMASCIGRYPKTFPDTHGSPILGMAWTALGAAHDDDAFRSLMDEHVWFFNLSHCPDGTFYYQPNRDNNAQDFHSAPRLSATAATALILSIPRRTLRITQPRSAGGSNEQRSLKTGREE